MTSPGQADRDRLIRVEEMSRRIEKRLGQLEDNMASLTAQANRWKGGFWVILGLGGIAGALLPSFINKLFQ